MLGPRRRVRPPLRLPGGAVRAAGRRRALRLRLLAHHGQRGRLLELLRRLPPGPLSARVSGGIGPSDGSKYKWL